MRDLDLIKDGSMDLVATHPPYAGIISYTGERVPGDLISLRLGPFLDAMRQVAAKSYRVLKPGRHCAILIGDTRKHKHLHPDLREGAGGVSRCRFHPQRGYN